MATAPAIGRSLPASADAAAETTRDLYERFSRQIFAYCLVQLRNREEAEDAVQTTFLNAFRALERGVIPELESAWLYKIAQHVCLTRRRSWSRRRLVESPQDLDGVRELVGAPVSDTEELSGLTDALRELPEQQRRAILLREWQGLTYKEIADDLQLSQAAVETLIFRARRTLAQSLEKLRGTGDLGSLVAAFKSLLLGGGTKVAATLITVATTSVVAATPAARHSVAHFVDAVTQTAAPAKPDRPSHDVTKPTLVAAPAVVHAVAHRTRETLRHTSKPAPAAPILQLTKKTPVSASPASTVTDAARKPKPAAKSVNNAEGAPAAAAAPASQSAAPAPPPPQPVTVTVPANSIVTIRTIDAIDSSTNHAGEVFKASLGRWRS